MKQFLLLVFLSLFFSARSQTGVCFSSINDLSYTTSATPYSVASGDFNSDGIIDLVSANYNVSSISILFGNALGKYNAAIDYTVGSNPTCVITTDFNLDGHIDIAVSSYGMGNVSVFISDGLGTFISSIDYTVDAGPRSIISSDVNNDGFVDLVSANYYFNDITVLIGDGAGSFTNIGNFNAGNHPYSIVSADFNNDGKLDVATANYDGNDASVLLGTGTGSFLAATKFSVGSNPMGITSADFNNDGNKDIAVGNRLSDDVSILLGNGAGNFNVAINNYVGGGLQSITSGDFDGDGNTDLATAHLHGGVYVLLGLGNSSFKTPSGYAVGTDPRTVIASDINLDGKKDLVTANLNSSNISILKGNGAGGFFSSDFNVGNYPMSVTTADFNNDGKKDIATANMMSNTVSILLGDGNGDFMSALNYSVNSNPAYLTSADFNFDGNADIVVSNISSNDFKLLLGVGNGNFTTSLSYTLPGSPSYIYTNDFNNDSKQDVVVIVGGAILVFIGNGFGNFAIPQVFTAGNSPSCIVGADLNNDLFIDLMVTNSVSNSISILLGTGTGSFVSNGFGGWSTGNNPQSITCADFNNDGKMDMVVSNCWTGYGALVYFGNGLGNFSGGVGVPGAEGCFVTSADFNGDGNFDIGVVNVTSKNVSVILGDGLGNFNVYSTFPVRNSPSCIIADDFNNDGKKDIVVSNQASNNVTVLLNNSVYLNASGPITFCSGGSVTLTAPQNAISYNWNPVASTTFSYVATMSNSYNVNVSTSIGSCASNNVSVTVNPTPTISVNNPNICLGQMAFFSPTGANSYTMNPGNVVGIGFVDSPTVTTTYSIVGTLNGCVSSVITPTTIVNVLPLISITGTTNTTCINSSLIFIGVGASTYTWNTGSTTASINITPTITTTYTVTGIDLNNCTNSQTVTVTVDNTCQDVWPGDANSDGLADNLDVLELGLHFTQTGTTRATTSNLWQSYYAANWIGTITNGKNLNHSNCNGDGIINDDDTLAIYTNYSLTHAFKPDQIATNPQVTIVADQSAVAKGTWGSASINLGNVTTPISNINGIAFTVNYDNALLETDSVWLEYATSFINASNQNLKFRKRDFSNGKLYTATTHTTSGNVSGYGKIATVHYKIKSMLATDNVLNLSISQTNQSNANGVISPLTSGSATLMAIGASVGINELTNGNYISIHPNPTNGVLTINSTTELQKIDVMAITGQLLLSEVPSSISHVLHLDHLANGVYFVNIYQNNCIVKREKIILNK